MKECKTQKMYSTGMAPPQDGKPETWMNSVISSPQPLTIKLQSLDNLYPLKKYLKSKPEVLTNLKKALNEYCEELKSEGAVLSCKKPEPDPPFPKSKLSIILNVHCAWMFFMIANSDCSVFRDFKHGNGFSLFMLNLLSFWTFLQTSTSSRLILQRHQVSGGHSGRKLNLFTKSPYLFYFKEAKLSHSYSADCLVVESS